MNAAAKIARWVQSKPMVMIRFDEEFSNALLESKQGFEHLTIAQPHPVFQKLRPPTVCLLEIESHDGQRCYVGTVTRKTSISTFDTRVTIKKLRQVTPSSLHALGRKVIDAQLKRLLKTLIPGEGGFSVLSPKLSGRAG